MSPILFLYLSPTISGWNVVLKNDKSTPVSHDGGAEAILR